MNVTLPEKTAIKKKVLIIYISIVVFCLISIIVAFYVQFYARIDLGILIGKEPQQYGKKTEEELQELKDKFDKIFDNSIKNVSNQNNEKRKNNERSLIYTEIEEKENKINSYDIDVNIPQINVDNKIVKKYNKEIIDVFKSKLDNVLKSENKNIIYTVEYTANIEYDILSLMIKSNLKEGASAQRIIIQTYNYDLRNNKEISLEEVLKIKNINVEETQIQIKKEIEDEQKRVEDLKKLGYNIYGRDPNSEMYNLKNSKQFYLSDNAIYIIYPYGNDTFTSEMDMIIL